IEDAAMLAQCLSSGAPVAEALARYAQQRMPRVARVAALSRANRDIYQARGPLALARNAAMVVAPPELLLKRMDWLYSGP
ncbi:MAG: monooxygenase, partial [Phyllobacteriaceae bacterium]|nr:monooxygenase [Phyllobacteriaceae bacterium]